MNKLSLLGMQLPEKYKEKFDVLSEGPSFGVTSGGRENYMSFYTIKNINQCDQIFCKAITKQACKKLPKRRKNY